MTVLSLASDDDGDSPASAVVSIEGVPGSRAVGWVELGLRAGLAVPVMAGSNVVGVLEFFADEPFTADPELLELLWSVGTQIGRVVERQRSEEARLRALVDNMPASVYLRDLSGRLILVNRQYEEFWDVRHDDIRGKTLFEMAAMTDVGVTPEVNSQVDGEVLATAEPRHREAVVVRRGKEHVIADVRFPVFDSSGQTVAVAGIDIDITAAETERGGTRRVAAPRRNGARRSDGRGVSEEPIPREHEPRAADSAECHHRLHKTRFAKRGDPAGEASRQPLQGAHQRRAPPGADQRDPRPVPNRGGRGQPRPRRGGHRRHGARGCGFARAAGRSTTRAAVVEADHDLPRVVTDRDKVRQILLNLLSNAIKYTDEGTIAVRADAVDGRVRVRVSDTGVGIPGDEVGKIFDEFHRAESTSAQRRGPVSA